MLNFKNYTAYLLALLIILSAIFVLPETVSAAEIGEVTTSGVTGDCTWTLDDEGTLTISGNGRMADYKGADWYYTGDENGKLEYRCDYPWNDQKVKNIVIGDGVTYIGKYAFDELENLRTVTLPKSLEAIGDCAFIYCINLEEIDIPEGVKTIGCCAFWCCNELQKAVIPEGVETIDDGTFFCCEGLTEVYIPESVTYIADDAFAECNMAVLYSYPGSVAGKYAEEHNMLYGELERENENEYDFPEDWVQEIMAFDRIDHTGDVNFDNTVDIMDSLMVQKYASGKLDLTDEQLDRADVNGDWYVDVIDAMDIQKLATGKISSFDEVQCEFWMCK